MHHNAVYEWILSTTFTVSVREKSLQTLYPYLPPLVHPAEKVLDLCCGSGPVSFQFEVWVV
jgi:ubiquinone/menaquinone biosynthesis C-methylase UbiE